MRRKATVLRQRRLAGLGARLIDFDYIMPPLRPGLAPHRLHMLAFGAPTGLSGSLVLGLLEELAHALHQAGVRLIATSSHKGAPINQAALSQPVAIFIGSEGSGLTKNLMAQVDELVRVPHTPQVESLNAGVAGSIVLYEAARQRRTESDPILAT